VLEREGGDGVTGELTNLQLMEQVRARRGLDPINPFVIEGSGEGFPPLTAADLEQGLPQVQIQPAPDAQAKPEPQKIFIPDYVPDQKKAAPPLPPMPEPALMVGDKQACYRGREVVLSEQEEAAIARVVLGAIQREISEQLKAVRALSPKRIRRVEAPKKRGRKPKEPNGDARVQS
jgi:hypothetical protein